MKSGHDFRPFCCDSIFIAIDCFGGDDIDHYYAENSKVSQEELERLAVMVIVSVEDWAIFYHGGEQSKKKTVTEYSSKRPSGECRFQRL